MPLSVFQLSYPTVVCIYTGPLPWDLLSDSSEDSLHPRQQHTLVAEEGQEHRQKADEEGTAVPKAPAPDAKETLSATSTANQQLTYMSILDMLHKVGHWPPSCLSWVSIALTGVTGVA